MPFACIFVPDFPVEAVLRAEPELRAQAIAVFEGKPPLQKIVSVNETARQAGVWPGMTKLQVEDGSEVLLRERSQAQEAAAHAALLDCAQSFSPRVEDAAADTVLLDLSGLEKLFGPSPAIAREISRRALEMGLETNVAVASTLEPALLAAHGFQGLSVVPGGKEAEFLGGLPVEVLFAGEVVDEEILETFRRWGVRNFRELAALPEVALSERLGQRGLELLRKARGQSLRELVPSGPPLQFEEVVELEFPVVLLEPLAFVLNYMLEQLCARLEGRALAAQELRLKLGLEDGRSSCFERTIRLPVPLLNAKTFLKLLQLDLKAHPPGAPVTKICLRIEPAKPRPAQNGLFLPASPEPEKLELTLARINGVVGEGRAGSPELLNTHRRDAFEMRRFTPAVSSGNGARPAARGRPALRKSNAFHSSYKNGNLVTALRIFRPPIVVRVKHKDGKPSHISSRKRKELSCSVLWAAGPWRSSGDWWERDSWIRDEWDIAIPEGGGVALYRLVHDLVSGLWMLEGSYD